MGPPLNLSIILFRYAKFLKLSPYYIRRRNKNVKDTGLLIKLPEILFYSIKRKSNCEPSRNYKFRRTIHGLGPFVKLFSGIKIVSLTSMKFIVECINFIQNIAQSIYSTRWTSRNLLYLYCSAIQKKYSYCTVVYSMQFKMHRAFSALFLNI